MIKLALSGSHLGWGTITVAGDEPGFVVVRGELDDGTIVTNKVNEMWGTDMTQTITVAEGRAYVFVAVEHANSEVVGIHAARSANRFEALEPVRRG